MKTAILQVVSQSCPIATVSDNNDGQQSTKCFIRLCEPGGRHADEYLCLMAGPMAERCWLPGTLVAASLGFGVLEKGGKWHQASWINEIVEIK